jgi:hypothetical protein
MIRVAADFVIAKVHYKCTVRYPPIVEGICLTVCPNVFTTESKCTIAFAASSTFPKPTVMYASFVDSGQKGFLKFVVYFHGKSPGFYTKTEYSTVAPTVQVFGCAKSLWEVVLHVVVSWNGGTFRRDGDSLLPEVTAVELLGEFAPFTEGRLAR